MLNKILQLTHIVLDKKNLQSELFRIMTMKTRLMDNKKQKIIHKEESSL